MTSLRRVYASFPIILRTGDKPVDRQLLPLASVSLAFVTGLNSVSCFKCSFQGIKVK